MDLQTGRGAVVVTVPSAQALLDQAAVEFGPTPAAIMPAHVTVLYPWLEPGEVRSDDLLALRRICSTVEPFDVVLDRFGTFPGVLWVAPEPAEPFVRLTRALTARWPGRPPYGGAHPDVTPHLSVLDLEAVGIDPADEVAIKDVQERLLPYLPIVHHVHEVSYLVFDGDGCPVVAAMPLG